jgi:hypothetical protein
MSIAPAIVRGLKLATAADVVLTAKLPAAAV